MNITEKRLNNLLIEARSRGETHGALEERKRMEIDYQEKIRQLNIKEKELNINLLSSIGQAFDALTHAIISVNNKRL
jgi:hypothetical protein